ncbi:MAG TPA: beta-galactosidase [Acidimicrobiales bacterium]|nr:beta-galactosidase [Acidimicrobiales bacterium]
MTARRPGPLRALPARPRREGVRRLAARRFAAGGRAAVAAAALGTALLGSVALGAGGCSVSSGAVTAPRGRLRRPLPRNAAPARRRTSLPAEAGPGGHPPALPPEGRLAAPGLYEFAGGNSATDAGNPDLAGTTLTFDWSALEPSPGVYDWQPVEQAIAAWEAAGKKVILRVSAGSSLAWGDGAGDGTPAWVYALGVWRVDDDGSLLPAYWDRPFVEAYSTFLAAYAARFDGDRAIAFIEMGIGEGGETLPDTQSDTDRLALWSRYGYSDAGWLAYVETVSSDYREDFRTTAVVPLVDSSFLGGDRRRDYTELVRWYARNGFPMQYDGLTEESTLPGRAWATVTTISEQRDPTSMSGDRLAGDCRAARHALHSRWLLVYRSDLVDPANAGEVARCAAMLRQAA